tara:strand:+ start:1267 stop:2982 length:1716 start_codon:yes stop_codon:yes gene_type:complete
MSNVIGIGHDLWIASAALFQNGKLTNAIPEERLNRLKGYQGFPANSIKALLNFNSLDFQDIELFCIGWNPSEYFNCLHPRFSKTPRWRAEMLYAVPNYILSMSNKVQVGTTFIEVSGLKGKFAYYDHHKCHAYCSHYLSPFQESINISIDGRGERKTSAISTIIDGNYNEIGDTLYPASLGLFYGAFTQLCGFRPHSDEWKFMALGALSRDESLVNNYKAKIDELIWLDGYKIVLDMNYFTYDQPDVYGKMWISEDLNKLLDVHSIDKWDDNMKDNYKYYSLAKAVQDKFEELVFEMIDKSVKEVGIKNLTLTGGCAMNSVANGKLHQKFPNLDFYIPPYPDDSGIAIGAAILGSLECGKAISRKFSAKHIYTGFNYQEEILKAIQDAKLNYTEYENWDEIAKLLSDGKIIALFQEASEFGQRALGNRSIIANPTRSDTKDLLNKAVKYREGFRPFAPSILQEYGPKVFENYVDSFYMERVLQVKKEWISRVPAIVHFDNSARVQTVNKELNLNFYNLIYAFYKITGVPLLVNTSFNLNGEPNVETPKDAIRTFYSCGLDYLVLGKYVITK